MSAKWTPCAYWLNAGLVDVYVEQHPGGYWVVRVLPDVVGAELRGKHASEEEAKAAVLDWLRFRAGQMLAAAGGES